jgi:hypothetical protein
MVLKKAILDQIATEEGDVYWTEEGDGKHLAHDKFYSS